MLWVQAARYARLDRAEMGIWEALELLGGLREYETALMEEEGTDADMPLPEHAAMTAEACRAAFPDLDWLHLVGLIHSLGKLLAHKRCLTFLLSSNVVVGLDVVGGVDIHCNIGCFCMVGTKFCAKAFLWGMCLPE